MGKIRCHGLSLRGQALEISFRWAAHKGPILRCYSHTTQGMYPTAIIALVEINRSISDDIENSLSIEVLANIQPEVQGSNPPEGNHGSNNKEQAFAQDRLPEINTLHP
jgi:hypothetical protein